MVEKLDFSFDMSGIDRQALLADAAQRLDLRKTPLGGEAEQVPETPEGALTRALQEDVAEFSAFPVVHKISDEDFLKQKLKVPITVQQLAKDYNFYWIYFPIALFPQQNWAFNRLEVAVEFNPEDPVAYTRPKAYQIMPEKKFQKLLELGDHLEVGIDEGLQFKAKALTPELTTKYLEGKLGGYVDVKAAGGLGLVMGPFVYTLKKAKINHTPVGMEKVFWRLDGAEFFQDDDPAIVVLTQIHKDVKQVQVVAVMQAYRYFSYGAAGLQQAVNVLVASAKRFFKSGLPLRDEASWDLTPKL